MILKQTDLHPIIVTAFQFEEVVMTTKQDKKNTPLFPGMKFGTQEEATAINNGGATQIVLNRRVKKLKR
jgi:hypothetical protein